MIVGAGAQQFGPEQRRARQIERLLCGLTHVPQRLVAATLRIAGALRKQRTKVGHNQLHGCRLYRGCHGLAVSGVKGGSERFMPPNDFVDRLFQRRRVEGALEPDRDGYIVERDSRFELFQEPQTLLRKGERLPGGARSGSSRMPLAMRGLVLLASAATGLA